MFHLTADMFPFNFHETLIDVSSDRRHMFPFNIYETL